MELLTAILIALIGVVSPVGWVSDRLAEDALRQQLESADDIDIRIDNAPNYRLLQGRVQRVRVAGAGLVPLEGVRIAQLNLEAEGIAAEPGPLRRGTIDLSAPLEVAAQIVLTETDLNQALQSPTIINILEQASVGVPGAEAVGIERYEWVDPQVDLIEGDRLQLRVILQERRNQRQLNIVAESGFALVNSRTVQLVQPVIIIDGQTVPNELLQPLTRQTFDIQTLIGDDFLVRLLQLEIEDNEMAIAAWVQIPPDR
ncbi:LmeA family phospholipid-binding protein [Vacuolonema iberomarrocanum]|uniref:LmeA family phospholipid-binding protein n=1 Tax=Vacuolonema iberomarrocanum TaxID=3454632 RepID=UPI0019EC6B03|nr:DUF2993 domain-containing protein [filamentous cyanobacterium LEGE 07170]